MKRNFLSKQRTKTMYDKEKYDLQIGKELVNDPDWINNKPLSENVLDYTNQYYIRFYWSINNL